MITHNKPAGRSRHESENRVLRSAEDLARLPPPLGHMTSELEEKYEPSDLFTVSTFGVRAEHVAYRPAPTDDELLRKAGQLEFEIGPRNFVNRSEHPLLSLRAPVETGRAPTGRYRESRSRGRQPVAPVAPVVPAVVQDPLADLPASTPPVTTLVACATASAAAGGPAAPATGAVAAYPVPLIPEPAGAGVPVGPVLLRVAFFREHRKLREFEVHSSQTLQDLREMLSCVTGAALTHQYREVLKRDAAGATTRPLPSDGAAFCIEDEWYVSGDDPSAEVRRWLAERRRSGAGSTSVARGNGANVTTHSDGSAVGNAAFAQTGESPRSMADVTFGQLRLRLGAQYLFVHHGNCEHDIVFTRCMLTPAIERAVDFPRMVWERVSRPPPCSVCTRAPALWDVHGDRLADVLPCHLCDLCHFEAHYTTEGQARRTDYRIYPLLQEEAPPDAGTSS
jgi:hypothetical protein